MKVKVMSTWLSNPLPIVSNNKIVINIRKKEARMEASVLTGDIPNIRGPSNRTGL